MKTDWEKIREEYLSQRISLSELARRHGLGYSTVRYHCVREGWDAQGEQTESELEARRVEQVGIKLLRRLERTIDEDGDIKDIKAMTGALRELRDIQQRGEPEQEDDGRALEVCFMGESGELSR